MTNLRHSTTLNNNNNFWKLIHIDNTYKIEKNSGLINYKVLKEERIIIFGGEKNINNNKYSNSYILKYNEKENSIDIKQSAINNYNNSKYIFYQNFVSIDNLLVNEENDNNLPLICNFDYKGDLWIFYLNKLRQFI